MKRFIICVLILTFVFTVCYTDIVFATSNRYYIEEMNLHVTIPSGYSVITRNILSDDPIFNDLGTTKSVLIKQLEENHIFLNALSDTYNEEVVVTMTPNIFTNFSLLSDTVLNTLASGFINKFADYGIDVSNYEIYQHSQAKFIKLYFTDAAKTVHGIQYYTIYNSQAMCFTMRSYEGGLSPRQETAIKTIVDSIKYDNAPPVSEPGEDTDSFLYTDTESGVIFTIPANWKQEEFTEEREALDVKFASTKEDGCIIAYGSMDMWEELSDSDRIGYTRKDFDNSIFTKSDVAEMYGTTPDNISIVTYNGIQYYKFETNYSSDLYGISLSADVTQLLHIDNGWLYSFLFGGTSTHKLYSDFESLLNSVQYPNVSNMGSIGSLYRANSEATNKNGSLAVFAVIILLPISVIVLTVVLISRKKNTVHTFPTRYTSIHHTPQPSIYSETAMHCKNCGQKLPLDSLFCHKCGAQIIKKDDFS